MELHFLSEQNNVSKAPIQFYRMVKDEDFCLVDKISVPIFEHQGWSLEKKDDTVMTLSSPKNNYGSSVSRPENEVSDRKPKITN